MVKVTVVCALVITVAVDSFQQLHQGKYVSISSLQLSSDYSIPPRKSISRQSTLMYQKKGMKDDKPAIEPKYLAAIGLVLFGALYDFFITHHGVAYLAHP